tara:strand:- start:3970 stop:5250 length:1281 start_codon:yes stop_codon:yes gene_type:complete
MGLGFFRTAAIAGGAAADVIRVADEKRETKFNDALNDFVDNNVPKFMEARQKRVGIKNTLKDALENIRAKYVKPAVGETLSINSQYELAEKILFSNGGKLENVDKKYTFEQKNSADPTKYNATAFVTNIVKNPIDSADARSLSQIIESKSFELSPDPTIDIQGKAEALAGYKDSVFFKMDRNTVAERLKSATGFVEPPATNTRNLYADNVVGLPSADKFDMQSFISSENNIKIQEGNIYTQAENKKIGQYGVGKVGTEFKKSAAIALEARGVKLNYDNQGKWKILAGKPKDIHEAYLDTFEAQTKNLFNNGSLSLDRSNYSITSVAKNVLPDLTTIANVSIAEKLPTSLVERQTTTDMMPTGTETFDTGIININKVKPFRLYQRYRTIIEEGKRKSVPYGDKFMFTATKRVGNNDVVQVKSKYIFK